MESNNMERTQSRNSQNCLKDLKKKKKDIKYEIVFFAVMLLPALHLANLSLKCDPSTHMEWVFFWRKLKKRGWSPSTEQTEKNNFITQNED